MKMAVADLANIEGRLVAWYANEEWKLEAFRAYDAKKGPDLYKVTAASILGGDPYEVSKTNRNAFGKVPELAFGFGGGAGAAQTFAVAYGVRMSDYRDVLEKNIDESYFDSADRNWEYFGSDMTRPDARSDMTQHEWYREWIASEVTKLSWRDRHPATKQLWSDIEDAYTGAMGNRGRAFTVGRLKFIVRELAGITWLLVGMPSGKCLTYLRPEIGKDGLTYEGMNPFNHQWGRVGTFGGKVLENIAQSTARDIMAANMLGIDALGWNILTTVHDEVVAEREEDEVFDVDRFTKELARNPLWAKDLPLAAEGASSYQYGKF